jgi:hypothetical protein
MSGGEESGSLGIGNISVLDGQAVCGQNRSELVQRLAVALPNLTDDTDMDVHSGRSEQTDRRSQLSVALIRAHYAEDQHADWFTWSRGLLPGRRIAPLEGIGMRERCERDNLHLHLSQLSIAVPHRSSIELGLHDDGIRTAQEKAHPRPGVPAY